MQPVTEECNARAIEVIANAAKHSRHTVININIQGYEACVEEQSELIFNSTKGSSQLSVLDRDREAEWAVGAVFHPSISINNHTYRGEYHDPNDLFKSICSVIKDPPTVCSAVNLVKHDYQDQALNATQRIAAAQAKMRDAVRDEYVKEDKKLVGMERRARLAEVVLGLVIVVILNCACVSYCKIHNQQKTNERLQLEVNESVSQYFALQQDNPDTSTNRASEVHELS